MRFRRGTIEKGYCWLDGWSGLVDEERIEERRSHKELFGI